MQLKVLIKTAPGHAKSIEYQLRPFIIGRSKLHKIYANKKNDKMLWLIECKGNDWSRITKNVSRFDYVMKGILSNRVVRGLAKLTKEQQKELDGMLTNQTEVDIVKELEMPELLKEFVELKK